MTIKIQYEDLQFEHRGLEERSLQLRGFEGLISTIVPCFSSDRKQRGARGERQRFGVSHRTSGPPKFGARYLLRARLSRSTAHVIWAVLRALTTCRDYVRTSDESGPVISARLWARYVRPSSPPIVPSDPITNYQEHGVQRCPVSASRQRQVESHV